MKAALAASMLALAALPGCALLNPQAETENGEPKMMMMSDVVPLAGEEAAYDKGGTMSVPEEPSPFELEANGKPAAMQSDRAPPRSPSDRGEAEPRPIPTEPIP